MILTGDLHANATGELDFLTPEYLRAKYGSKCENTYIVVLGDGGFLWYDDPYSYFEGELIRLLDSYLYRLNSKLIVVPGNHENYHIIYDCLPKKEVSENTLKGSFREISPYIVYTERYGDYIIENKSILVLGGALSLDREIRTPNRTWFQEETYSIEDKNTIMSFIRNNEYDYVFAHTCPDVILKQIYGQDGLWYRDGNSEFYSKLMNYISPKIWFFGHLHPVKINDKYNYGEFDNLKLVDTEFRCLFKEIQDTL